MVSKKAKIVNEQGMHMRPATDMAKLAGGFESSVKLVYNGTPYDAKSVMFLMAACLKFGSEFEVVCEGPDEEAALKAVTEYIEAGLGD